MNKKAQICNPLDGAVLVLTAKFFVGISMQCVG